MHSVEIRLAAAEEADVVARLVCELFAELAAPGPSGYDPAAVVHTARLLLRAGGRGWALLGYCDRDPVAVLTLSECVSMYAGGRFGEICELYVRPGLRSEGLGERLLEEAARFARQRGWSRLEVGAPDVPRWQRSVDFYQRCGFVVVGPRLKLELRGELRDP